MDTVTDHETIARRIDDEVAGQTIASRWLDTVAAHPDRVALRAKDGDAWVETTYAELADRVARTAAGLQSLGVGTGDRVVLMMRNIPEFHVVDLAVTLCGATAISIYNSSAPEQIAYLVGHSGAKVAVVEDMGFAERFAAVREQLPDLEHLVLLSDPEGLAGDDIVPAATLTEDHDPIDLHTAAARITPDMLATVIYTSGTTGPPKGVMLTHRNIVWTVQGYLDLVGIDPAGFRVVSYLPMAHIAERMVGHYMALIGGFEVSTCPDPSLIATYAREVHPETMFGVPRVWEKIHAGVQAALAANPEAKQKFDEAVAAAGPIVERRTAGTATDEDEATWQFLDEVAFRNVRELIGLDAVQFAVSGAAPIPPELLGWFRAIGVPMSEVYGLSETTGPMTWDPYEVRVGTVGRAFPGVEVFLADDGEVLCRGGNVFAGYLDDPDKTAAALDDDGTFHSGDIGVIDDDGYLRIIDRKKELIITAGGKNVSPANLEAALKTIPAIGQACTVGDQRPFVSALVVLDPDVAPGWFAERGIEAASIAELADDPRAHDELQRAVDEVMTRFSNAERVKKLTVLGNDWLPDGDELTPTSKLKRRSILAKYADRIEALYD
ncbi:MAG: long-chain fatty acid--CoA ligase [Acidimicrobiales bacterium]|nr:long-chain fatty acid--CoA ligase [Acidimicrobiales bacterium]